MRDLGAIPGVLVLAAGATLAALGATEKNGGLVLLGVVVALFGLIAALPVDR